MKIKLVYVDDSKLQQKALKKHLESQPFKDHQFPDQEIFFTVHTCGNLSDIKNILDFDILLLDINLGSGEDQKESEKILEYVKRTFPDVIIVMYSGTKNDNVIIDYMILGADNFISKELSLKEIHIPILQTYLITNKKREIFGERKLFHLGNEIKGETILSLQDRVQRIVTSNSIRSVLVTGETGTGKEVIADLFEKAIHSIYGKDIPFIRINCGAFSETLIESELFGSVRGAFTDAVDKKGFFEIADGGWIFLDEVATLSTNAQNSLMRVIENNELKRVGSTQTKKINVRVISATNKNLKDAVKEGYFRHDLLQRLNATEFYLPPLKNRSSSEIENLIVHFAKTNSERPLTVSDTTLKILKKYNWREGNIRELKNTLSAMSELATSDGVLYPNSVPRHIYNSIGEEKIQSKAESSRHDDFLFYLKIDKHCCTKADIEQQAFALIFNHYKDITTIQEIGKIFGISHATAISKAKELENKGLITLQQHRQLNPKKWKS